MNTPMTLPEILAYLKTGSKHPVWHETHPMNAKVYRSYGAQVADGWDEPWRIRIRLEPPENYGHTFRYWLTAPTREERQAARWE